ncbi:MAG TPA: ATP-binding protein, partial [Methylomirabilota bacterium]|nr:ATP-binding protein [Methylomirabilota bacterium]
MTDAFSINRESDYVRLEGLYRTTGRSAHEWDLYILKELIDNALDADEFLWRDDPALFPSLYIHLEYITVPSPQCQQLIIHVANRASFPVEKIEAIFNTRWYSSEKAFVKGITRGALGNALKTLLGIPYALHNRLADDWKPDLKPLSICCHNIEYLPRYIVDSMGQAIHLNIEKRSCKPVTGTLISVGLDYFVQEIPRTLEELELLAQLYHLCNPHARFDWKVEIGSQTWTGVYTARGDWSNKYQGLSPIKWYSQTAFKELLGALYRKQFGDEKDHKLPLKTVCQYFAGFNNRDAKTSHYLNNKNDIIQVLWQNSITQNDINGPVATELHKLLSKHSPHFDASRLGCIGEEYMLAIIAKNLSIEGNIKYKAVIEEGRDSGIPFVIELAVASLQQGKRQIWTAINFSPTYSDPFLGRWLSTPGYPAEPVLGLRGLLDAYSINEDAPFIFFFHLICPNIEHTEFSKTEINHLPFEKMLGEALDQLMTEVRRANEDDELRLQQTIFQVVDRILMTLSEKERFIP